MNAKSAIVLLLSFCLAAYTFFALGREEVQTAAGKRFYEREYDRIVQHSRLSDELTRRKFSKKEIEKRSKKLDGEIDKIYAKNPLQGPYTEYLYQKEWIAASLGAIFIGILFAFLLSNKSRTKQPQTIDEKARVSDKEFNDQVLSIDQPKKESMNDIIFDLPKTSKDIKHRSSSDPDVSYTVNLSKMICSCPDFTKRRSELPLGSIRRACKHIRKELLSLPDVKNSPLKAILKSKYSYANFIQDLSIPCIIGYSDNKEWINIFAQSDDNDFREFGYSILEERWSYDNSPSEEEKILELISAHFSIGAEFEDENPVDEKSLSKSLLMRDELRPIIKEKIRELYKLFEYYLADGHVDADEVTQLISFIKNDEHLSQICVELLDLLNTILKDGKVDTKEQEGLTLYFRILARAID
jgi:hypothetical protein